jgi:hypothetical protein
VKGGAAALVEPRCQRRIGGQRGLDAIDGAELGGQEGILRSVREEQTDELGGAGVVSGVDGAHAEHRTGLAQAGIGGQQAGHDAGVPHEHRRDQVIDGSHLHRLPMD